MRHWSASNGDWLCAASRTTQKNRPPLGVREKACGENKFAASPLADVGSAKERLLSLAAVCGELQPL